jgi:hypothetical protein
MPASLFGWRPLAARNRSRWRDQGAAEQRQDQGGTGDHELSHFRRHCSH